MCSCRERSALNLGLLSPWALMLLPLTFIPWFRRGQDAIAYPSLDRVPEDPLSDWLDRGLRAMASLAVFLLILGMSGPYEREKTVHRIGTGAHIVLLLDRSSSMNENFTGRYLGQRRASRKVRWQENSFPSLLTGGLMICSPWLRLQQPLFMSFR